MPGTAVENRVDVEEVLSQSAVDDELRALLVADPGSFGLPDSGVTIPTGVEPQDRGALDMASGPEYVTMCGQTCNVGHFTIVCDGTTK